MGVTGLWQLLKPVGQPVSLETLENKVLAVDVSIWLNQAVKGFRDAEGHALQNAHLLGLFHRVCKLLYCKIKPIFVFDGRPPSLKKQTLAARQEKKQRATEDLQNTNKQILINYLNQHLIQEKGQPEGSLHKKKVGVRPSTSQHDSDLFKLPPLPEEANNNEFNDDDDAEQDGFLEAQYQHPSQIDVDSSDFQSLPPEIRHEILLNMKEHRKRTWNQVSDMPQQSEDFSEYQMKRLLGRRKLQRDIEKVQKEISHRRAEEYLLEMYDDPLSSEVQKVASDDCSHYMLITGLKHHQQRETESLATDLERESTLQRKNIHLLESKESNNDVVKISDKLIETPVENKEITLLEETIKTAEKVDEEEDYVEENPILKEGDNCPMEKQFTVLKLQSCRGGHNNNNQSVTNSSESPLTFPVLGDDSAVLKLPSCRGGHNNNNQSVTNSSESPLTFPVLGDDSATEILQVGSSLTLEKSIGEIHQNDLVIKAKDNESDSQQDTQTLQHENDLEVVQCVQSPNEGANAQKTTDVSDDTDNKEMLVHENDSLITLNPKNAHHFLNENPSNLQVRIDPTLVREADDLFPADVFVPTAVAQTGKDSTSFHQVIECDIIEDLQERAKLERQAASVTDQMHQEAQELLRLFGIPFVASPAEAEAQCAQLEITKLSQGTITDDGDIWLFGGSLVYKNFFTQGKYVEKYDIKDIAAEFGLSQKRFICFAMLTGSDYTEGLHNVGHVTAMEILGEFPGDGIECLQRFREWWDSVQVHDRPAVTKTRSSLRKLVLNPGFPNCAVYDAYSNPEVDKSEEKFSWGTPDLQSLRDFAEEKFGWTRQKTDEMLLPVMKKVSERQSQTRLDSFFTLGLKKEKNLFPSKRLKKAVSQIQNKRRPPNLSESSSSSSDVDDPDYAN